VKTAFFGQTIPFSAQGRASPCSIDGVDTSNAHIIEQPAQVADVLFIFQINTIAIFNVVFDMVSRGDRSFYRLTQVIEQKFGFAILTQILSPIRIHSDNRRPITQINEAPLKHAGSSTVWNDTCNGQLIQHRCEENPSLIIPAEGVVQALHLSPNIF
jgi:hypothetical protein